MSEKTTNTKAKYDGMAKTLHWIVALLMIVMLTAGWTLGDLPLDEKVQTLVIHSSLGLSVFILMFIRLYSRRKNPPPALPDHMPAWKVTASKFSHHALYFFVILQTLLGLGQSMYANFDVRPFGAFSVNMGANESLHSVFHELHEINAMLLIALILLHLGAALNHHFVQKDTVLKRMLPYGKA